MKKKLGLIFLMLSLPIMTHAKDFSNVVLGQFTQGSVQLNYNGTTIPTYKAGDSNYVVINDLKALGFEVDQADNVMIRKGEAVVTETTNSDMIGQPYSLSNATVTLENFETMSLASNDTVLIPMAALSSVGTLSIENNICTFSPMETVPAKATQDEIKNLSDSTLNLNIADIYWDGNKAVTLTNTYTMEPQQTITDRTKYIDDLNDGAIYLATMIQSAQSDSVNYNNNSTLGQVNTALMQDYIKLTTKSDNNLDNLANPNTYVAPNNLNRLTNEEILNLSQLVNSRKLTTQSKSPLLFYTDTTKNCTYLFKEANGSWNLLSQGMKHDPIKSSETSARKYSKVSLGKFEQGSVTLNYNGVTIPTYKAFNANYIATSDLRAFGYDVSFSTQDQKITISTLNTGYVAQPSSTNYVGKSYTLYTGTVQVGLFETQALTSEGSTFIPVAALNSIGKLVNVDNVCTFSPSGNLPVYATQTTLTNLSDLTLEVKIADMYWDGKENTTESTVTLAPFETVERAIPVKNAVYLSTIIQSVNGQGYDYATTSTFGQLNTELMKRYTNLTAVAVVSNGGSYGDYITSEQVANAEAFVNNKGLSSPTQFLVWTNIATQKTYVFQGSTGNWSLLKMFICSTGRDHTPTPRGTFHLTQRVPSFGQNKGYCCKYAFGFIGTTYLYHSIIYDVSGTYLLENKGVLGQKASQGCIRFAVENAKWFYDTLSPNTTVYID